MENETAVEPELVVAIGISSIHCEIKRQKGEIGVKFASRQLTIKLVVRKIASIVSQVSKIVSQRLFKVGAISTS